MKTLLTVLVTSALVPTAFADGKPDPALPKEIQGMHRMVGDWKSEGATAFIAGKKRKAALAMSCSPTAGGMGILCNSTVEVEGLGRMAETDLFGYDAGQNKYHWFAVTQMGETHDHVALPPGPNDKGLTFVYSGYQEGKPMQEVISLTFLDPAATRIDFKNSGVVGGEPAWKIAATIVKK
jgi:hypothetical protein